MIHKTTNLLILLSFVGVLSLAVSSPTLAKTHAKASSHRASPAYQYNVRRVVPVAPVVRRCPNGGVWDPYGLRCDTWD
jgi:hypothetical protein